MARDLEKQRQSARRHYERNRDAMIDRAKSANTVARQKLRDWLLAYLVEHPCIDCGEDDPVVLEFDHRGEKLFNIGDSIRSRKSLTAVIAEVAKCDIRCANCHRRKTYRERGFGYKGGISGVEQPGSSSVS